MRTYKVAWLLFKNNIKLYKFYMMVLTFIIAIYYNFLAIAYNPYVAAITSSIESARTASVMCSGVLFVVLLFFMLHATNFFYKQRYKEIATYMIMGIKKNQIARVIALESIIVGGVSLLAGGMIGLVFSKLFFMILGSRSILNTHFEFYFSLEAVEALIVLIGSILVLLAFRNSALVKRSKLITLLNASKKEESEPKQKVIRGLLGVIGIGWGYYLAIGLKGTGEEGVSLWVPILLLVCVGTYLVYSGFFSLILKWCIANKKFSYKRGRLISLSNTFFRLGSNYRSYAATTILCAATLTCLMLSLSLKQFDEQRVTLEAPYSLSYLNEEPSVDEKVEAKIKESTKHQIIGKSQIHFFKAKVQVGAGERKREDEMLITSYSEIEANLEMLKYPHRERILKRMKPSQEKVSEIKHATVAFSLQKQSGEKYQVGAHEYTGKTVEKIPFLGAMPELGGFDTLVVTNEEYRQLLEELEGEEQCVHHINLTHQEESLDLMNSIIRIIPNYQTVLNCYAMQYKTKYYLFGAFYFLGFILSIIFMVTVFSTIYFKCMSEAYSDQKQYAILKKMGMSKETIKRSINSQLMTAMVLPILLGILHSLAAICILEGCMHMNFLKSKVEAISIVAGCMILGLIMMSQKYMQMVTNKE